MSPEDAKRLREPGEAGYEPDWNAVYADQLRRIYNYFRFRVGSAHDVEELTARTFEKAWRARTQYRHDLAGFSTWLFAIARNVLNDHLRSERLRIRAATFSDATRPATPEDQAAQGSDMARLATLMAGLPERQKELV